MIACLHCHAETTNGLALCELCQRKGSTIFDFLPIYFRNLARWRPGRSGTSRPVPGSRVLWDGNVRTEGSGDRISDTLDETTDTLTAWATRLVAASSDYPRPLTFADAVLIDDLPSEVAEALRDDPARRIAALCGAFEHHLTSISTIDWCGQFLASLDHHETRLRALTEAYVPGWYAGGCRQVVAFDDKGAAVRCNSGTYVVPGLTWVTCSACGTTTYARDHLEHIRTEASDWIAPPKRLAEAVVALLDTEQSVPSVYDRIRQWASRDRLLPVIQLTRGYEWDEATERMVVADVQVGRARYRLGDVLDVLHNEATTRRPRKSRVTS